jgi:hypothetical protein
MSKHDQPKARNLRTITLEANEPNKPNAGARSLKPDFVTDTIRPRKANARAVDAKSKINVAAKNQPNQVKGTARYK